MSDNIIGIAVLTEVEPGKERLYALCCNDSTKSFHPAFLSIRKTGTKDNYAGESPCWEYQESTATMLMCHPSVRLMLTPQKEIFHNSYQWSVEFKRCENPSNAYEMFERLNADLKLTKENEWDAAQPARKAHRD